MKDPQSHWWRREPGIVPCPRCGCPIQRTGNGTVADGMTAHFNYVHPNETPRSS